jgi:hypothetical protein
MKHIKYLENETQFLQHFSLNSLLVCLSICYKSYNPNLTRVYILSNRSKILHAYIKSETMYESVDRENNFESLQNFYILKKFENKFFHNFKIKLEIHCTFVTSKTLNSLEVLSVKRNF